MKKSNSPLCVLSPDQRRILDEALRNHIPVVIDGNRSYPTGKTTLCDFLRKEGAVVVEQWELEERHGATVDEQKNTVQLHIYLNRPVSSTTAV